ncbi:MAG: lipoprotein-releasing ABC transporter permease subunit, partial [Rhodomicrobiaceae bacterium]
FPIVEGQALITTSAGSNGAFVRGVREADLKRLEGVSSKIMFGSLDGFDKSGGIAIGTRLANTLGVQLGDEITVVAPRGAATPFGTAPRIKRYPITAIFEIGMSEYDATIAFLPLAEGQRFFNTPNAAQVVEVLIDNPDRIDAMRPLISAAAGEDMLVTDWRQRNATFYTTLQVERNVMFVILTLIVLVAALNIVSGLIMLVKDKGRDIGILRTMGATRGAVMRVFFITGASIGVVGTLAGLLIGVLVCANIESIRQFLSWLTSTHLFDPSIYFLSRMPAEMDFGEVASVAGMALTLSILATLYPSWRAARLDPVEALRYE